MKSNYCALITAHVCKSIPYSVVNTGSYSTQSSMYKLSWHFCALIMPQSKVRCRHCSNLLWPDCELYVLSLLCRFNQIGWDGRHMFGGLSCAPIIRSITTDCGCGICGFTEKEKAWQVQGCLQPTIKWVSPLLLLHMYTHIWPEFWNILLPVFSVIHCIQFLNTICPYD